MQTQSSLAAHTKEFYDWEVVGRGWHEYGHLVSLEPTFHTFMGYRKLPSSEMVDDGQHHSFLSGLWHWITRPSRPIRDLNVEPHESDLPPQAQVPDVSRDENIVLIPADSRVDHERTISFLRSLAPAIDTVAFELVGKAGRVSMRFATSRADTALLRSQFSAFFPTALLVEPETDLVGLWHQSEGEELEVVEVGLAREFVVPLENTAKATHNLVAFIAALSNTASTDLAIVQVLFTPAQRPWSENAAMALRSPDGEPFFIDTPELTAQAEQKLCEPFYAVRLRLLVKACSSASSDDVVRGFLGGLNQYGSPRYNSLIPLNSTTPAEEAQYNILLRCTNRPGMILSLEELASIVQIPDAAVQCAALDREVPVQDRLPDEVLTEDGVLIGAAEHEGQLVPVRLGFEAQSQHTYVIGASGTGKSTLLEQMILEHIAAGHGVGLVDPHGDLADRILARVPDNRIEDVILLDPAEPDWIVGWNILAANSEVEKMLLASDLVAAFQRLSTSWGDQMSTVLGNAVLTFLQSPIGGTLVDLRRFLLDDTFRNGFIAAIDDEHVRSYWREEFPLLIGKKPQAPILTRLNSILRLKQVRDTVVETERPIDFRGVIDRKKIFLAKLSVGAIGEEASSLLGSLIVSKFHQTALTRQDIETDSRIPFFLFVDEFQEVATPSMASLFSGVRKYKLALCVAHQDTYQLHATAPELERSILTNAYTRIVFRVSDEDANKLGRGFVQSAPADLVGLARGEAICRVGRNDAVFCMQTYPPEALSRVEVNDRRLRVKAASFARYGKRRSTAQQNARGDQPRPTEPALPEPLLAAQSSPGRGGRQHKYVQSLIKRVGLERGYDVETEKVVLSGHGYVDVALSKPNVRIACEISVTTSVSHEIDNLIKCLAAGFDYAVLVSTEEATLRNAAARIVPELTMDQQQRVVVLTPNGFIAWLDTGPFNDASDLKASLPDEQPRRRPITKASANAPPELVHGKQMFDSEQASAYLRRATQTLAKLRCIGGGPAYYKIGRSIYYDRVDLDLWLESRKRRTTSDVTA